jgi:flagellar motor switch protein FliG
MESKEVILKDAHDLYYHRGRILKRLNRASVSMLARFADALETISDEDLDAIAQEIERLALKRVEEFYNEAESYASPEIK